MTQESTTNRRLRATRPAGRQPERGKAMILAAASPGQFMIQMDLTIVNVALSCSPS